MNNKLFFICPDCCSEQTIKDLFGENVYFLTGLGTVFDFSDLEYSEYISSFIYSNEISEIYFATSDKCRFTKLISKENALLGLFSEKVITDIIHANFLFLKRINCENGMQNYLAEIKIKQQLNQFITNKNFYYVLAKNNIKVTGLIIDFYNKSLTEIDPDIDIKLKKVI